MVYKVRVLAFRNGSLKCLLSLGAHHSGLHLVFPAEEFWGRATEAETELPFSFTRGMDGAFNIPPDHRKVGQGARWRIDRREPVRWER
jgi:hypothetical protein